MTIRVKHRVWVHTFGDTDERLIRFAPDPEKQEVITEQLEKQANADFSVLPSSTDTLSFGDIDAVKGMYLEVRAPCKVRLNGSLDSIDLVPVKGAQAAGATAAPARMFLEAPLTQVDIENEDVANPLTGVYVFWGDETP